MMLMTISATRRLLDKKTAANVAIRL